MPGRHSDSAGATAAWGGRDPHDRKRYPARTVRFYARGMAEGVLPGERRKLVTALFCDVVGSTDLGEAHDPEVVRGVLERWFGVAEEIVSRHGGLVEKFVGDAVTAVFGVPVAHEDDALRACQAALALLAEAAVRDAELRAVLGVIFQVRVGVESGVAVVGDATRGSTFATGAAVNLAARLQQAASPGACLVGPACRELVLDVVELDSPTRLVLKGVAQPVAAARLRSVPTLPPERVQADVFVGRNESLSSLVAAFEAVSAGEGSGLVTVLGEPGMGKTRFIEQFLGGVSPTATVLRSRCLPYGDGVAWWPLVEIIRQVIGLSGGETTELALKRLADFVGDDGSLVASVLGAVSGLGGSPSSHDDLAWAFGRLLEQVASVGPVALVVEDVHWAQPGLVEVLDDVTMWLGDLPVLVLVDARPEFATSYPTWGSTSSRATNIGLRPLSDADVDRLLGLSFGGPVATELSSRIRGLSAGNPLFVHQMVGLLRQSGRVIPTNAGWQPDTSEEPGVPAGMTALIASRIDQLPESVRQLAGAGAVMGQLFYRRALAEVGVGDVGRALGVLLRNGMVRVCGSDLPGEQALQFEHQLVRDAAYNSLTSAARSTQHERFARWLLREHPGPAYEGIVGSHLESAYRCRIASGQVDFGSAALGVEAADRLARAGRQLAKVDEPASIELFRRAVRVAAGGHHHWALELELAFRLFDSALGLTEARALADRLSAEAGTEPDAVLALSVDVLRNHIDLAAGHADGDALDRATEALASVPKLGSFAQLLLWDARAMIANVRGDLRGNRSADLAAAVAAEQLGYAGAAAGLRRAADFQSLFDPTPVDVCRTTWHEHLDRAGDRSARLNAQAALLFLSDIAGAAADHEFSWDELEARSRQVQTRIWEVVTVLRAGAALALGQWGEAHQAQTRLCNDLEDSGSSGRLSTEAGNAAIAAAHLGDEPSVSKWIDVAEHHGSHDDASTGGLVAAARAWLSARHGDRPTAQAQSSIAESALTSDMLMDRAVVAVTLARAAELVGDMDSAARFRDRAATLYRVKGAKRAAVCV